MKKIIMTTMMAATAGIMPLSAQSTGDFTAGIGFMERSDTGYAYIKANGVIQENKFIRQKLGLEYIGYGDTLDRALKTDLLYTTFVANYEVEFKSSEFLQPFLGVGAGFQHVDLDSPVGSLDDDIFGYAQVFGGVRAKLSPDLELHIGLRRMMFGEADLLGVSNIKQKQTWGAEIGITLRF